MTRIDTPEQEYTRRAAAHRAAERRWDSLDARLGVARLAVVVVAIVLAVRLVRGGGSLAWLAVLAVVFVVLVVVHERIVRRRERAARAATIYDAGLARLRHEWIGVGPTGLDLVPDDHPYALDLDVVGEGSLFQRISTSRTGPGRETLAWWLLSTASPEDAASRAAAVRELAPALDLREDVALIGDDVADGVAPDALRRWADGPYPLTDRWRAIAFGLTVAIIAGALLWGSGFGAGPFLIAVIGVSLVWGLVGRRVQQVIALAEAPARELRVLATLLERAEGESFTSPFLVELLDRVRQTGESPRRAVARLNRTVDLIDSARNQFFGPIAFLTLWNVHFAYRLEDWRRRHAAALGDWLTHAGRLDAILAVSGFAYENPGYAWPEIDATAGSLAATDLGHPLLPAESCVRNDIALGGSSPSLVVVSGSNMSGKSTFLRSIGTNVVLAYLGAPVYAASFRVGAFALGASIRTTDSLRDGRSRFYAEIVRLKALVDLADGRDVTTVRGGRLLFLIDEILAGTNSHDREAGARALLLDLVANEAIGLATTHDLALTRIADEAPNGRNVHFSDRFVDGVLEFDYRLREGVVQTSNAIPLMRSVGLRV